MKKKVKAWACVLENGGLIDNYFTQKPMPVFRKKESAELAKYEGEKVVPVTITYSLPQKKRGAEKEKAG